MGSDSDVVSNRTLDNGRYLQDHCLIYKNNALYVLWQVPIFEFSFSFSRNEHFFPLPDTIFLLILKSPGIEVKLWTLPVGQISA